MKRLTLVRHAKSSWKDDQLSDFQRPLNKRGRDDAPMMGKRLARRKICPQVIVSSPATRALTTAEAILEALNMSGKDLQKDASIYEATVGDLLALIHVLDQHFDHVMLVGHNPGFTYLSTYLSDTRIYNIPTCGVFCMDFDVHSWVDVAAGLGVPVFYDYPKNPDAD